MEYKKISVEFSRTVNLGNYESARFSATLETDITLDDAENIEACYDATFMIVKSQVQKQLYDLLQGIRPNEVLQKTNEHKEIMEELEETEIDLVNLTIDHETEKAWKVVHPIRTDMFSWVPKKCGILSNGKVSIADWFKEKVTWKRDEKK